MPTLNAGVRATPCVQAPAQTNHQWGLATILPGRGCPGPKDTGQGAEGVTLDGDQEGVLLRGQNPGSHSIAAWEPRKATGGRPLGDYRGLMGLQKNEGQSSGRCPRPLWGHTCALRCEPQGDMVIAGEETRKVCAQRQHNTREIHAVRGFETP